MSCRSSSTRPHYKYPSRPSNETKEGRHEHLFGSGPSNPGVVATDGTDFAYRDLGEGAVPLVLLQHFRGNLENWDPALIDALASRHRVVTFDNVGVGATTGTTAATMAQMGRDAIEFMTVMGFGQVDLLGFSIGSFVAQEVALTRPSQVRRLILASIRAEGRGKDARLGGVRNRCGGRLRRPNPEGVLGVFYSGSTTSRTAGQHSLKRISSRTGTNAISSPRGRPALHSTTQCANGVPELRALGRYGAIKMPVFIANGDSDPMILPRFRPACWPRCKRSTEDLPRRGPWVPVSTSHRICP